MRRNMGYGVILILFWRQLAMSYSKMPGGIPVATVALDGAKNAGILAAEIIGAFYDTIGTNLANYKQELKEKVEASARELEG